MLRVRAIFRAENLTLPFPPPTLQGLGATIVVDDSYARTPAFTKLLADLPPPMLGFNAVGGASFTAVSRVLGHGASLVTYGGMSRDPVRVPTSVFTRQGLRLSGFSLARALAGMTKAERDAAVRAAADDLTGGDGAARLQLLVAREPFADFGVALARSYERGERKVVLVM